jgi:hypothetical protein
MRGDRVPTRGVVQVCCGDVILLALVVSGFLYGVCRLYVVSGFSRPSTWLRAALRFSKGRTVMPGFLPSHFCASHAVHARSMREGAGANYPRVAIKSYSLAP